MELAIEGSMWHAGCDGQMLGSRASASDGAYQQLSDGAEHSMPSTRYWPCINSGALLGTSTSLAPRDVRCAFAARLPGQGNPKERQCACSKEARGCEPQQCKWKQWKDVLQRYPLDPSWIGSRAADKDSPPVLRSVVKLNYFRETATGDLPFRPLLPCQPVSAVCPQSGPVWYKTAWYCIQYPKEYQHLGFCVKFKKKKICIGIFG